MIIGDINITLVINFLMFRIGKILRLGTQNSHTFRAFRENIFGLFIF